MNTSYENFSINDNNNNTDNETLNDFVLSNPNIVFTNILGDIYYIQGNDCIIVNEKLEDTTTTIDKLFKCKKIYSRTGYYDYINNSLVMVTDSHVYTLCFKNCCKLFCHCSGSTVNYTTIIHKHFLIFS